jgi:hypothetical protein
MILYYVNLASGAGRKIVKKRQNTDEKLYV